MSNLPFKCSPVSKYLAKVVKGFKPLGLNQKLPSTYELPPGVLKEAMQTIARAVSNFPSQSSVLPRALIVGGYVRDLVRGEMPLDADMQVYGVAPEKIESVICNLFPGKVHRAGKSYEILIIKLTDKLRIDLSLPRKSLASSEAPFECGSAFICPREAAKQRDFSMNNLAMDPISGEIFDWFGGIKDMSLGALRVTCAPHFIKRSIHPYRAAQFSARFGFMPDIECYQQIALISKSDEFAALNPNRLQRELTKLLLSGKNPSLGLEVLRRSAVIERKHRQLAKMIERYEEPFLLKTYQALDRAADAFRNEGDCCSAEEKLGSMYGILCHAFDSEESVRIFLSELKLPARIFASAISLYANQKHKSLDLAKLEKASQAKLSLSRPVMMQPFSNVKAATGDMELDFFHEIINRIYPATWKMQLFFDLSVIRSEPVKFGKLFSKLRQLSQLTTPDWKAKSLLEKKDLTKALGLSSGAHLGFIIGEVEKRRFELVTKSRALTFVSKNFEELMSRFTDSTKPQ
jgi:tRNA nucleotidyltransferase/poly(A) polymerase